MFAFQFTTIVYTAGKISLNIFQLVSHAYKMSSMYIWIPYSRTIFKHRTDKRLKVKYPVAYFFRKILYDDYIKLLLIILSS